MTEIICAAIAATASVICAYAAVLQKKRQTSEKNREEAERKRAEREEARDLKISALCESQKIVMLDRIRYLGQKYIEAGEIDFDDRRILNAMHDSYHNGLGGNGDADVVMHEVNKLPLRKAN